MLIPICIVTQFTPLLGADGSLIEVQPALATRRAVILATDLFRDKSVLCIGLGTCGAHSAIELAKCGVGKFNLAGLTRYPVGPRGK